MAQFAETQFAEFGKVSVSCPVCRIFYRQTFRRIRRRRFQQTGFRETGQIPVNMGESADFGKLSLPCPVCRVFFWQTVPRIRLIGIRQTDHIPLLKWRHHKSLLEWLVTKAR